MGLYLTTKGFDRKRTNTRVSELYQLLKTHKMGPEQDELTLWDVATEGYDHKTPTHARFPVVPGAQLTRCSR